MRKLFQSLFYVPKYGKMKESTFFAHLAGSVAVIILSLAAMGFSAYAYFSCSMTAASNTIVAAKFDVAVSVLNDEEPVNGNGNTYSLSEGTYTFTLERTQDSNASTGYCVVNIGNRTYITAQLGADVNALNGPREKVSFTLILSGEGSVDVTVTPGWGTSALYATAMSELDSDASTDHYITDGAAISIRIADVLPGDDLEIPEATEPETTEPEATEPEVTEPETTESEVTEPETTEPETTEPEATEPEVTEPEATEPEVTEPEATEPEVTEPQTTEPETTEPDAAQYDDADPLVIDPVETEPEDTESETGTADGTTE